jgi:hypothetical protein
LPTEVAPELIYIKQKEKKNNNENNNKYENGLQIMELSEIIMCNNNYSFNVFLCFSEEGQAFAGTD